MLNKKIVMACITAASLLSANLALAQEEDEQQGKNFHLTLSAKMWNESWSTWQRVGTLSPYGNGTLMDTADNTAAFIGGVTARFKNGFVSANYAPQTSFDFPNNVETYKRSEYDVNVGYYLHPQIGLSLGYKSVELEYNPAAVWTHNFLTLGLNSSARIGDSSFFMYQNGAISLTGSTDVTFTTVEKGTPEYQSLEAGLGVSVTQGLILTAGYKFQQIELPLTFASTGLTVNTRDTTTGFIFGAAYTF
jgi:hypothetical protein